MILSACLALADDIRDIRWSPDGRRIATLTYDERLRREEIRVHEGRDGGYGGSIDQPDGELTLVWRDSDRILISGRTRLWEYSFATSMADVVGSGGFTALSVSPDGQWIAGWSERDGAKVLRWADPVVNGRGTVTQRGGFRVVRGAPESGGLPLWTPDGHLLVIGAGGGTVARCAVDGTCGTAVPLPVVGARLWLGMDGLLVAAAGTRTMDTIWASRIGPDGVIAPFVPEPIGAGAVSALAIHPTTAWRAVATPGGDVVMSTGSGTPLRMTVGHYRIDALAWAPEAPVLAVEVDGVLTLFRADPEGR